MMLCALLTTSLDQLPRDCKSCPHYSGGVCRDMDRELDRKQSITHYIRLMKQSPSDYTVQMLGCKEMGQFAGIDNLQVLLAKQEGIVCVVEAMNSFHNKETLQLASSASLLKLATASEASCIHMVHCGGVTSLVTALRIYPGNIKLVRLVITVLGYLSVSDDFPDRIMANDRYSELIYIMSRYTEDPDLIRRCASLLSAIAISVENAQALMFMGCVHSLVDAMKRYSDVADLQESGCRALGCFASYDETCIDVAQAGGTGVVSDALKRFPDEARLLESASWALACLTKFDGPCGALCNEGVVEPFLSAMERYPRQEGIQEYGCWTICNMAASDSGLGQLASQRVWSLLLASMKLFPENVEIQEQIAFAASQIVMTSASLQAKLVSDGGIKEVVAVMASYPEDSNIQEHGCRIIGNIAVNENLRRSLEAQNCSKAIISAMLVLDQDEQIQLYGCHALANIAADVPENKICISNNGGVTAILVSLRNFFRNQTIVECALRALSNLVKHDKSRSLIVEGYGHTFVPEAMVKFPASRNIQTFGSFVLSSLAGMNDISPKTLDIFKEMLSAARSVDPGDSHISLHLCKFHENVFRTGRQQRDIESVLDDLLNIMEQFPDDPDMQMSVCTTLAVLVSRGSREVCDAVTKCGGIGRLIYTLSRSKGRPDLALICTGALSYLAENQDSTKHMKELRGIWNILSVLQDHGDQERVQVVGLLALTSLVSEGEPVDTRIFLGVLVNAMKRFPDNIDIQISTCKCITVLNSHELGLGTTTESPLTTLLVHARHRHSGDSGVQSAVDQALASFADQAVKQTENTESESVT